jgi:hypothetical protein
MKIHQSDVDYAYKRLALSYAANAAYFNVPGKKPLKVGPCDFDIRLAWDSLRGLVWC